MGSLRYHGVDETTFAISLRLDARHVDGPFLPSYSASVGTLEAFEGRGEGHRPRPCNLVPKLWRSGPDAALSASGVQQQEGTDETPALQSLLFLRHPNIQSDVCIANLLPPPVRLEQRRASTVGAKVENRSFVVNDHEHTAPIDPRGLQHQHDPNTVVAAYVSCESFRID